MNLPACHPLVSSFFFPFFSRCPRAALAGPAAAAILKSESHSLVLQYECKYGHLRTAGLWIMEAGCPWYSWEGGIFCHSKKKKEKKTHWEKVHNLAMYISFPLPICTLGSSDSGQKWNRSSSCGQILQAFGWLYWSLLSPFSSREASETLPDGTVVAFFVTVNTEMTHCLFRKTQTVGEEPRGDGRCRGVALKRRGRSQTCRPATGLIVTRGK